MIFIQYLRVEHHIRALLALLLARSINFILSLFLRIAPINILTTLVPPRPCSPIVTKEWFTEVLKKKNNKENNNNKNNGGVVEVKIEAFDAAGFVGAMKRIRVIYKDNTSKVYVMKMNEDKYKHRHAVIANHSYREALFYAHPLSSHVPVPPVVYSYGSYLLGDLKLIKNRYVIITEDISQKEDFTKVGPIFGNQIWGVTSPSTRDPVHTLNLMFSTAADFHAKFWRDESLFSHSWLRCSQWYKNQNRAHWELCLEKGRSCWREAKERAKKGSLGFEISPKLFKIIEKSFAMASWENNMQKMVKNNKIPFTLSHGDYHAGNMVLAKNHLFLVDWSQCGVWEPTSDLAQTLISDVKPEIFLKHSKELVKNYWDRLISLVGIPAEEYPK